MFIKGAIRSLCRIAEFLIFLLSEARKRAEEDVERGEALNLLHSQIQQALVVFVEKLRPREQALLASCALEEVVQHGKRRGA